MSHHVRVYYIFFTTIDYFLFHHSSNYIIVNEPKQLSGVRINLFKTKLFADLDPDVRPHKALCLI